MKVVKLIEIKKIIKIIIISCLINFIYIVSNGNIKNLNEYIVMNYGYIDIWNISNIVSIIKWILINSISLLYLGNYIETNLIENADILFTRTSKRGYIILKYIGVLFLYVLIINLFQFIFIIFYCYMFKYSVEISNDIIIFWVRITLYNYLMVLTINCISIFSKSVYGLYFVLLVNILMSYICAIFIDINAGLIKFIPISNCLISLREVNLDLGNIFSIYYLISLIIIVMFTAIKLIQKKEFIS